MIRKSLFLITLIALILGAGCQAESGVDTAVAVALPTPVPRSQVIRANR